MNRTTLAFTLLRIVAGILFFSHGAQKLFGWFGGFGPSGGTVNLMSLMGAAGIIEVIAGIGIALGLALSAGAMPFARQLLYNVSPFDPLTFGAVTAILAATALAASYIPARRAARIDPVTALRED